MIRTRIFISYIFILILLVLLPGATANAEEKYTYKDYSATMEVTKDTNIRTEPSLNGEKVGYFPGGTEIEVTGICNETGWYRITYEGETRYLSNIYLKLVSVNYSFTNKPGRLYVSNETNIRTKPCLEGEKVGKLAAGEEFYSLGRCNETGWYKIVYNKEFCYVSDLYVMDFMVLSRLETFNIITPIDIRRYPNDSSDVVGHLNVGDFEISLGITEDGEYYQVQHNGKTGFIPVDSVEIIKKLGSYSDSTTSVEEPVDESKALEDKSAKIVMIILGVIFAGGFVVVMGYAAASNKGGASFHLAQTSNKNSEFSVFGIDWDHDGKTSMADDGLSMSIIDDFDGV